MTKYLLLGLAPFLFQSFAHAALNLSEAQALSHQHSPILKASAFEVEATDAAVMKSNAAFFPMFGVESRYQYYNSEFEKRYGGTGNLFAEWNLFNGFQDFSTRKAAKLEAQATQLRHDLLKQSLNWEVEEKFSEVLYNQEALKIHLEALEKNTGQKKMAQNRRSAGLVSQADVLEFELYESMLQAEIVTLESNLREAQTNLKVLLGKEDLAFPVEGSFLVGSVEQTAESVLKQVQQKNIELQIADFEVDQSKALKTVANGGFMPSISAYGSYGSQGLRETTVAPETYVGVFARWELFSGFETLAARREAQARIAQAEVSLQATQISIKGQSEQLFNKIKALEYRMSLEKKNLEGSDRYMKTVLDEYRRGVKNSSDVKSASEGLLLAAMRDVQYRFDFVKQKVALQKLMGGPLNLAANKK